MKIEKERMLQRRIHSFAIVFRCSCWCCYYYY